MNKGTVTIDGKTYNCEVVNGERFIDGKTVDEFMKSLPTDTIQRLAQVGEKALIDEKQCKKNQENGYQEMLSELEFLDY